MGVISTMDVSPVLSRRERNRSLTHRRLTQVRCRWCLHRTPFQSVCLFNSHRREMYLRRNETNFRMLSKTTAQGSVPCVRKTITIKALPRMSGGMNPISILTFSCKKLGPGADRCRCLRQKPGRDHHQGCSQGPRGDQREHQERPLWRAPHGRSTSTLLAPATPGASAS
jgi:hypothetical protein